MIIIITIKSIITPFVNSVQHGWQGIKIGLAKYLFQIKTDKHKSALLAAAD